MQRPLQAILSLVLLAAPALAQTHRYQIVDIGVLPGQPESIALSINASGAVVGRSGSRPFLYKTCSLTDLGLLPGGTSAVANAINNNGVVAGQAVGSDGGTHAVDWHGGSIHLLLPGLTYQSQSRAISNAGRVVGYEYRPGTIYGIGFENDQPIVIPSDNDQTYGWASVGVVVGVNGSSQMAGYRQINNAQNQFVAQLGLVTLPGSATWIRVNGPSSYTNYVTPWAINEGGAVTGWSQGTGFDIRAFLSTSPGIVAKNLGTLGGTISQGFGLNNARWVVGYSTTAAGAGVAFLYDGVSMVDLNTTLVNPSGWQLTEATAINDYNQIVGVGIHSGQSHAFLLNPVTTNAPIVVNPCTINRLPIGIATLNQ